MLPTGEASLFSFPDEAVTGTDTVPSQDDYRTHQQLLKRVAQNLGIQVEEVRESFHALVDILTSLEPSSVVLSLRRPLWTLLRHCGRLQHPFS